MLRRTAEKTPTGMAMPTAMRIERQASSMVIGSFLATVFTTGSRVRMDSPRSPRSASPTQRRYWSDDGVVEAVLLADLLEPGRVGVGSRPSRARDRRGSCARP